MSGLQNTDRKFFPLDIHGVRNYGMEEWFNSYSEPVSATAFYENREKITKCFSETMPDAATKPDLHQIWLANYKIALSLSDYYFKHSVLEAVKGNGYDRLMSDTEMDFDTARRKYRNMILGNNRIHGRPFPKHLIDRCRFIRQNKFNPSSLYPGFNDRHRNYIIGDRNKAEIRFFLEENGIEPYFINPALFIRNGGKELSNAEGNEIRLLVNSFFSRIFSSIPESKVAFDESVRNTILETVTDKYRHYLSFSDTLSKYSISGKDLLVSPCGNMLYRLFSCAWRRHGGTVTGFSHGNPYSYCYTPGDINNGNQMILDKYITCSKGESKLLDDARNNFRNGLESRVVMETCRKSFYRTVFDSIRNAPAVKSVKKVMVMGFPYSFDIHSNLLYLHLEISIIKMLKDAGFQVLYKAHPDSLSETSVFFRDMTDSVITDNFEKVFNMADCVVFPIHHSTTFGFALMTNRPIVIMESPLLNGWHPDITGLVGKRCCSVKLSFNEKSLFSFDRGEFTSAVIQSANRTDHGIIEAFAF